MAKKDGDEIKQIISIEVKETGVDKATKDVGNLSNTIDETTDSTKKLETAQKSFKSQLREANQELQNAVNIHGETSKEALKAAKAVAELKDQMGFAKDLADSFNPDQKMKALGAASQVAATGVSAVTSGMALFGDQSENTQAALLKVQAAMAFSDSISGLSDLGDQWKLLKSVVSQSTIVTAANTAATTAASAVQKALGIETIATSVGFKVLKGAIVATGLGALAIGIIALVQNFDKVKEAVLKVVPGLSAVGDIVMDIVNSVTDFIGVTSEADRALDRIKANADKSLALNKKFLDEHGSQLDDYTKQKIDAVNEYHELIKEDGANQVALFQELNRKLAKADQDRQDEIDKARKEAYEKEKAAREKAQKEKEAAEKKAFEDSLKASHDRYEKEQELLVEQEEERNRSQKELQQPAIDAESKSNQDEMDKANSLYAFKKTLADKEESDDAAALAAKQANQAQLVSSSEQLIKNVQQLAGKNKAIQKAAIIADGAIALGKAGMNTAEAVTKDLAKGAPFSAPLVALDIAVGATSAAAIISNSAKALSAVGGGSIPSAGSSPSVPTRNTAQVGFQASSENQIASSISKAGANAAPIQAFVVSNDVKNQLEFDRKKELGNHI